MRASAFVPAHISGFFRICDEPAEPEKKGSRGAGPTLDAGVLTKVEVESSDQTKIEIYINGQKSDAETTRVVTNRLLQKVPGHHEVLITHECQVPIGAGYGASGAGALGTALALNEALKLRLPRPQIVTHAHVAEVTCGTGYGDVMPQTLGGLVVSKGPGSPAYGDWIRIHLPKNLKVICGNAGPISTREILTTELRKRSKELGEKAISELLKELTYRNFMRISREFAERLGLLDDELRSLIEKVKRTCAIDASMVMLGKAVFALVENSKLERVRKIFSGFFEPEAIMVSRIDFKGARLLGD